MRLIDADKFKQQVAAATIKMNLPPEKTVALMELIDRQPTVSNSEYRGNWIPVSERLPSKMMSYWVACADGSVIQQGGTADLWSINKSEIIAWMPNCKPEPPKEDAID